MKTRTRLTEKLLAGIIRESEANVGYTYAGKPYCFPCARKKFGSGLKTTPGVQPIGSNSSDQECSDCHVQLDLDTLRKRLDMASPVPYFW